MAISETHENIDRIMGMIRSGQTAGLEILDIENGWIMSDLRMHGDGLVDYSGRPTGRISISPEDIEQRLRNGGLLEAAGDAGMRAARREGFGTNVRAGLRELSEEVRGSARSGADWETADLIKIAALISGQRGDPLDETANGLMAAASAEDVKAAVMRLASDPSYRLDEYRQAAPDFRR